MRPAFGLPPGRGPDLNAALNFSRAIDAFNHKFGLIANYLVLFAALLSAANAGFRYGINALIELSREFHFLAGIDVLVKGYGNNSNAFSSGMITSVMTRSPSPSATQRHKVAALPVIRTSCPSRASAWFSTVRIARSSSATRIVAPISRYRFAQPPSA